MKLTLHQNELTGNISPEPTIWDKKKTLVFDNKDDFFNGINEILKTQRVGLYTTPYPFDRVVNSVSKSYATRLFNLYAKWP